MFLLTLLHHTLTAPVSLTFLFNSSRFQLSEQSRAMSYTRIKSIVLSAFTIQVCCRCYVFLCCLSRHRCDATGQLLHGRLLPFTSPWQPVWEKEELGHLRGPGGAFQRCVLAFHSATDYGWDSHSRKKFQTFGEIILDCQRNKNM